MNDDIGAGVLVTIILVLTFVGFVGIVVGINSFVLNEDAWHCTKTTVVKGAAACAQYERKESK